MIRFVFNLSKNHFSTLVLGEHNGKAITKNTMKLLSAAHKFGEDVPIYIH